MTNHAYITYTIIGINLYLATFSFIEPIDILASRSYNLFLFDDCMKIKGDVSQDTKTEFVDPKVPPNTTITTALPGRTKSTFRSKSHQHMGNNNGRSLSILPRLGIGRDRAGQEYELVEGGQRRGSMSAMPMGPRKRFNWRIVVALGLGLFVFVALFGPRERRKKVLSVVTNTYEGWNDGTC